MDQPLLIRVPDVMPPPAGPSEFEEWTEDLAEHPVQFVVGVDLGQAQDFSTIIINHVHAITRQHHKRSRFQVDGETLARSEMVIMHRLRYVTRVPLHTSYPAVIERVASAMAQLPPAPRPAMLVVDATGCGRPVLDLMRVSGLTPIGVTITAGSNETIDRNDARVAKRILASSVAVALDSARLTVPAVGPDVEVLRAELRSFKVKVTESNNDTFLAWRENAHDDLVLGAALAVWAGERIGARYKVNPNFRLLGRN